LHFDLSLVVPLLIACLAVIVALPFAAKRGRLHIPGYVGVAFLALMLGLVCGRISAIHGVARTPSGILLAFLFFLLIATAVGSVLALFFYADPPQT
jgi:drug/metabolite transporter (DMT)-like permease